MPRIERRTLVFARNLALLSLAVAVAPTGYRKLRAYLRQDAFAEFRKPQSAEPVGIRLEGVRFRHFSGQRMLTFAAADRIDVSRDRYRIAMFGVHDGLYRDGDRAFRYQAQNAQWDAAKRILTVAGGVHIKNNQLDVKTNGAKFESRKRLLSATGDIKGTLAGGRFYAQNLLFNTETEAYEAGPVGWTGKLPAKLVQEAPEISQRQWNFRSDYTTSEGKKSPIVTHTNAIATDGEVIVIAAKIVHNRQTDEILASGTEEKPRIQYFSAKANMVANRVQVFRKERRAIFTGSVVMLVKPKSEQKEKPVVEALPAFQPLLPSQVTAEPPKGPRTKEQRQKDEQVRESKNIRDYPLVMNSAKIEYWYTRGARRAVITGDPQGRQEMTDGRWRHIWSNVGFYDGEKEELKLVSTKGRKDTRLKDSVGDDAVADWVLVSLKDDDDAFTASGLEGDFADISGTDDPRNAPATNGAPTPPTNPPAGGGGSAPQKTPPPTTRRRA